MTYKMRIWIILLVLPFFLFMSTEEGQHKEDPMAFVGKVVNFVILFGGLTFLLYKPARNYLAERGKTIEQTIKEAGSNRQDAEAKLKKTQVRLKELEVETARMRKEAESEGKAEEERIIKLARQETERLKQLARQEIELISNLGARELKEYAAGLAMRQAEKSIIEKITNKDHKLLIDKSIERLEDIHEKSSID